MAYEGWLSYAGTEILNASRVARYSGVVGVGCDCPALTEGLGDSPYTDPARDNAAWYDPSVPESARFYGLTGLEIIGADSGTLEYQWTELLGDGGVPGAARRASKEIEVKALAAAGDSAAMAYGMEWLASALRGSGCRDICFGDSVCLLAACPQPAGSSDIEWRPDTGSQFAPGLNQLLRTGFNTTLLEPQSVTKRYFLGGQVIHELRFTLRIGVPYWYREPRNVVRFTTNPDDVQPAVVRESTPLYDPWGWQALCQQDVSCLTGDPFCVNPPLPPVEAGFPADPCFPNDPRNNPPGQPDGHKFPATRMAISIARGIGTDWGEKVPVLRLYTGSLPWRRLAVRWYDNPTGQQCTPSSLDPCRACSEINIPYLPQSTVFTLDAQVRRAYADCPGTGPLVEPRMYGPSGGPFSWPLFDCSAPLCAEVIVDTNWFPRDGWIELDMVTRGDAV